MIEVNKLEKMYETFSVFEKISFRVGYSEGLFVTGPSGCGKTTLLRILVGLEKDYSGLIRIDDADVDANLPPGKRNVAIVFQDPTLWNHMTVLKNITYGMEKANPVKIRYVAERLGIDNLLKKYPEEISGGQAKRVSLARALLSEKKNLLLDEPLSNVDVETKKLILDFIADDYIHDRSIIYVTHDSKEIENLPFGVFDMKK